MLDGFGYLLGQIAVLLVGAMAVGVLAGRYGWPRATPTPTPSTPDRNLPAGSPARPEGRGHPQAAAAQPLLAPAVLPATEAEKRLAETLRRVAEADAEVLRMRAEAQALANRHEAEMGRLESGALSVLESTIAAHTEHVATLEGQLQEAEERTRQQEQQLDAERRRTGQLQLALTERDAHATDLMATIAELEHRLGELEHRLGEPGRGA